MSILSYPERGQWGKSSWRGNCSGHVYKELFERLQPKVFVDPMVGSGTSVEVAKEMNIEAHGLDLHSGFNAISDSILLAVGKPADLCLSHPPYGGMIVYSGNVWGQANPNDLSRCESDEDFHEKMQLVLLNQREATAGRGYYGTIIGDWRRSGVYTSYQAEMIARMPREELAAVLIKAQHNCTSDRKQYGSMKLPFILHEYILLWQKKATPVLVLLNKLAHQQYGRLTSTWKNLVKSVLMQLGGKGDLGAIYEHVQREAPQKLSENPNWKAKVRQTLNQNADLFKPVDRGVWAIA
ncbi:MAG: hypothetical protein KGZ70_12950 [Hydrogenophaga sp.]|nr:hypothetical protein [Hydrogenophaga sp.]